MHTSRYASRCFMNNEKRVKITSSAQLRVEKSCYYYQFLCKVYDMGKV